LVTTQSAPSRWRTTSVAAVSFSRRKVLWSRRFPENFEEVAGNTPGAAFGAWPACPPSSSAVIVQYSSFTKARISRFALRDQADGDRLHATRREAAAHLLPEERLSW